VALLIIPKTIDLSNKNSKIIPMGYEMAISKAWEALAGLKPGESLTVKFQADEYAVDLKNKSVFSLACNVPAKDPTAILILHYLLMKLKGLPELANEWLTFRGFSGIEGYYPVFKKRAIEPLIRKYGRNPASILDVLDRFPSKRVEGADVSIVLNAFEGVPALVQLWRGDEEFGPDANMLFDKSITKIFCTEDIVVLAGMIASQL
jgi:hypothetical protein